MSSNNKTKKIILEISGCNNDEQFEYSKQTLMLDDVSPRLIKYWFQYSHLLKLNIYLLCAILASINYGYDSSMMGNLQNLPSWSFYFDHPSGGG